MFYHCVFQEFSRSQSSLKFQHFWWMCFDFNCCRDGKTSHIWRIFYYNRPVVVLDFFTLTYSTYSLLSLFSRQILFIFVYISLPLNCATRLIREKNTVLSISADASLTDHDFFHILFFSIQYFDPETTFPRSEQNGTNWPGVDPAFLTLNIEVDTTRFVIWPEVCRFLAKPFVLE